MTLDEFLNPQDNIKKHHNNKNTDDNALMSLVRTIISEENLNQVKIFEKLSKETQILFIIAGKYNESYGAIAKGRIRQYCLTMIRSVFPSINVFKNAWDTLSKQLRWIEYIGKKEGWFSLSPKGMTVFSQIDKDFMDKFTPDLEMVCAGIRSIQMPPQHGGPKRPKKFMGYDLLIYYDAGEIDRILFQIKRNDEFYGNCMIICCDAKDKGLDTLIKSLKNHVETDPIIIEHEGWRPKSLPVQLKNFLKTKRYKLRFICSAYPRIGMFAIVGYLLKILNDIGYYVDFEYARAGKYCYGSGSPETLKIIPTNKRKYNRVFWLGEVNDIRLNEILPELEFDEFHVIMNEDIVGHTTLNPSIKKVLENVSNVKPKYHYFNLTNLDTIIYKLARFGLNSNDCVILGGNRFAVIGAAILYFSQFEKGEQPFGIAWLHIESDAYSKGVEGIYNHQLYARRVDECISTEIKKIGGDNIGI